MSGKKAARAASPTRRSRSARPARSTRPAAPVRATHNDRPYREVSTDEWSDLYDQIEAAGDVLDEALDFDPATIVADEWREEDTLRKTTPISDETILDCIAFIKKTRLVPSFDKKIREQKGNMGRPNRFTVESLLVALWWCATERQPLHLHEIARVLTVRISPAMAERLGIRRETKWVPVEKRHRASEAARTGTGQATSHTDLAAAARSVGTLSKHMLSAVDPSVLPKNKMLPHADLLAAKRDVSEADRKQRQAALDWVCNEILQATFVGLPTAARRQWLTHPSACIDATPMKVPARQENSRVSSSDPDAGLYLRYKEGQPGVVSKAFQAYDLHLIISGDDQPGRQQRVPGLILAMTADRPGVDPTGAARRLFSSLDYRNLTPKRLGHKGYLSGDRLYTQQDADYFQLPAQDVGFGLVLDYRDDQLADKQPGHTDGAPLVEGQFVCPAMPKRLVNATEDYRAKRIDWEEYKVRIAERNAYRMRVKERGETDGTLRLRCPAAGDSPTASCVLKPKSQDPRPTRQPDGRRTDARLEIIPFGEAFDRGTPHVCAADSFTVKKTDGAKYRQAEVYGSDTQINLFSALRSTQEGGHGFAKDEAQEALGSSGLRRVRGKAAQSIFAALLLAAANVRKIASFTLQAVHDPATATIYVIKKMQRRDNRWNTPEPSPAEAHDPSDEVGVPPDPGIAA